MNTTLAAILIYLYYLCEVYLQLICPGMPFGEAVFFVRTTKTSPGMPSNPLEKQFALLGTASTAGLLDVQKAYRFFLYIKNCFRFERFMKLIRRVSEWPLRIMVMLSGGQSSYTI